MNDPTIYFLPYTIKRLAEPCLRFRHSDHDQNIGLKSKQTFLVMFLRGPWRSSLGPLSPFSPCRSVSSSGGLLDLGDLSPSTRDLYEGLLSGDRGCLARSITLVESSKRSHALEARKLMTLIEKYLRATRDKQGFRLGLSGPPGNSSSSTSNNVFLHI